MAKTETSANDFITIRKNLLLKGGERGREGVQKRVTMKDGKKRETPTEKGAAARVIYGANG